MKHILCTLLLSLVCFGASAWDPTRVALHLVGDSTMSNKPNLAYPERGWGQLLPQYMTEELEIVNHAANGRSTRRFLNEGRWALVLSELKAGDYVLIQFGHNDQKEDDPARYASADKDYPAFLRQYIKEVRAKDATPMIASSICRRHFDEQGNLQRKLLDYASAAKQVAESEGVEFFDLNEQTCGFLKNIGEPESRQYFIQVPPDLYTRYPEGKTDNTHLNVVGAAKVAQFFIRDLKARKHPLANYVYRDSL
ncbi:rhamnogalacturonan acetylesterase [Alteromonas lipolytica]|uniref:GntR family transcriptional regulator n=1 Tax=Alteromonas lipolytica TaxID=1856405 RepID=A0A1E8FI04_9ALTE|nr:rhamnogalacturonan acetylesterase [Alteromonas lipolytica]OFI35565.1 GntR family transcriptional regulator [Alteromonas lipolytica]GGF77225.1 rhamnogalacturonan acetylesterase [Alteromonas lipolytica]